ncbi:LysE/ArgO family amino acid transporter [Acinetobacter tianfuensis]|uniref:Amino acid transporter n=1 Tax=Acinetobacter tianfuensis TaxID=2419603 RepID=A0A3A8E6R5_9GAMM|nr:LysE/ArgO family amino acid transporter [Acinetobacter tianfuensis]RKG29276.1 amino acid transporter [Acinetobacter tianfuensis]
MLNTYLQGLLVGLSLIVAIGAQNAFVLKQGLKRRHVFWVCLVCALSDAVLILFGVMGFSAVLLHYPQIIQFAKWGGALFLFFYGVQHAVQAWKNQSVMTLDTVNESSLLKVVLIALALTWLNPHVYLDTVILLGSISTKFSQPEYFAFGAISASLLFFFSLGYGARALLPLFQSARAWRILDAIIALIMWGVAISLLYTV